MLSSSSVTLNVCEWDKASLSLFSTFSLHTLPECSFQTRSFERKERRETGAYLPHHYPLSKAELVKQRVKVRNGKQYPALFYFMRDVAACLAKNSATKWTKAFSISTIFLMLYTLWRFCRALTPLTTPVSPTPDRSPRLPVFHHGTHLHVSCNGFLESIQLLSCQHSPF